MEIEKGNVVRLCRPVDIPTMSVVTARRLVYRTCSCRFISFCVAGTSNKQNSSISRFMRFVLFGTGVGSGECLITRCTQNVSSK